MKTKFPLLLFLVVVFTFVGCNKIYDPSNSSEQSSTAQLVLEGWEDNYVAFLKDLHDKDFGEESPRFFYKDINGDGVPELIVARNGVNLSVYIFEGAVTEIGERNFGTATTRFLYSDNPSYPGIFFFFVGGGVEHYGYLTVKDNEFIYEELWNEDYSGFYVERDGRNRIEEYSDDKGLINESRIVYSENNDIDWRPIP